MTNYKGYYIDKVIFNNKLEIDEFIKKQNIDRFIKLIKKSSDKLTMELSVMIDNQAEFLVKQCGLSYRDVENLEISNL